VRRAGATVRHRAHDVREGVTHAGRDARHGFDSMLDEQPLVLGALALAFGAALGAVLPRTETEDELFGEQSDRIVRAGRSMAEEEARKLRATAAAVADEARTMAGEAVDSVTGAGSSVAESAGRVVDDAARRLKDRAVSEAEAQHLGEPSSDWKP
jgi:hypothetical protein